MPICILIKGTEDDPDPYWRHICSKDKFVADILTKNAIPDKLGEGSEREAGPDWLIVERSHWPVTEVVLDPTDPVVALSFEKGRKTLKSQVKVEEVSKFDDIVTRNSRLRKIILFLLDLGGGLMLTWSL